MKKELELIISALNQLDELERAERDAFRKRELQRIGDTLAKARGILIAEDRAKHRGEGND